MSSRLTHPALASCCHPYFQVTFSRLRFVGASERALVHVARWRAGLGNSASHRTCALYRQFNVDCRTVSILLKAIFHGYERWRFVDRRLLAQVRRSVYIVRPVDGPKRTAGTSTSSSSVVAAVVRFHASSLIFLRYLSLFRHVIAPPVHKTSVCVAYCRNLKAFYVSIHPTARFGC